MSDEDLRVEVSTLRDKVLRLEVEMERVSESPWQEITPSRLESHLSAQVTSLGREITSELRHVGSKLDEHAEGRRRLEDRMLDVERFTAALSQQVTHLMEGVQRIQRSATRSSAKQASLAAGGGGLIAVVIELVRHLT